MPALPSSTHSSTSRYGALAFGVVIVSCFCAFLLPQRSYYAGEWAVLVTFALGIAYTLVFILGGSWLDCRPSPRAFTAYYLLQCALVTTMLVVSPVRGFFGIVVLPLASQSILDLRARGAAAICTYLFALNIAIWGIPFGWNAAFQAMINYSTGFAFTILFTVITRQALVGREREEGLRRDLEEANTQLRAHAAQAEELATTRERNRVAREIHDGVGHYLTVVKTQLDAAAALLPADPTRARAAVTRAATLAAEALEDVRRSVGTLRTDAARRPLPEALTALAAHGEPVPAIQVLGTPRPLSAAAEHALFRTAQEGLTNVRKHARARSATLQLDFRAPDRVRLELADDGAGANGSLPPGHGLQGLRERAEILGGRMTAATRPGGGFALAVEIPG